MTKKILTGLFTVIIASVWVAPGFAETIYLKDGRVIKEKIIERGPYYIVTQENNIPRRYYDGQIERIEEEGMDTSGLDLQQYQEIGMPTEKAKLIADFINVSGVRKNMEQNLGQVMERVPEANRAQFEQLFNVDEIIELLIPLYDRHYTETELRALISFYESPAGKKMLEATPEIMKESVGILVNYVKEKQSP